MAIANGRLPSVMLAPVPGGQLRRDAAGAWLALDHYKRTKTGTGLAHAGDGATYRVLGKPSDYPRGRFTQWFAWRRYQSGGNLAARPGTSNHGWGTACDFAGDSIDFVKAHGAAFGWRKTEAPGEPWHYCFVPGHYLAIGKYLTVHPGDIIHRGQSGPGVVRLKQLLKQRGFWPRLYALDAGFGPRTENIVKKFQKAAGLKPDGIVGPTTWKALKS